MIKFLKKLRIEGTYLNISKATYNKPIANIILNGKKLKPFPLKSRMSKGVYAYSSRISSQRNKTGEQQKGDLNR
jgi:hypothetical protein